MYFAAALAPGQTDRTKNAIAQAKAAEAAGLDLLLVGGETDGRASLDPLMLASALASVTSRLGIMVEIPMAGAQPYNVARRLASIDLISHGRCGWLVGAPDGFSAWDEAFLSIVSGLLESWDDGAFLHDKAAGRMFDPAKLHRLNHAGAFFSVRGPLNVGPSAQRRPLIALPLSAQPSEAALGLADILVIEARSINDTRLRAGGTHRVLTAVNGAAGDIAEQINDLLSGSAIDGIIARPSDEAGFAAFLDMVARHRSSSATTGTLRERLGLPRPHRVAAAETAR